MREIAISIVSKGDPIHVNTRHIEDILKRAGYEVSVTDLDWATAEEWRDMHMPAGWAVGRHARDRVAEDDQTHVVRRYDGPEEDVEFVRDFFNHDKDLEAI